MKTIRFVIPALFLTATVAVFSCQHDDLSLWNENDLLNQAQNEAITEAVLQKVDDQIDKEINMLEKFNYNPSAAKSGETQPCNAKITVETPSNAKFPKTITLDFGSGCTDTEGNFRAGKIVVHITGPYWQKNTIRNSKLVDYIFNDLKVAGAREEVNKGQNDKDYYIFEVKHSETIKNTEGKLIVEREWNRIRTYNRGNNLASTEDDEVWITGIAEVDKNGKEIVKKITTPLYRKLTCQYFQSGVIATFAGKEKIGELNYGEGVCDDIAVWTNGKVTKEIKLKTGINLYSLKP
jgi:hypothetical protein